MTIHELKERVNKFIEDREWKPYHTSKNLAISITLEASELLEIFQWLHEDKIQELMKQPELLEKVESELADILIYCISFSNTLDIDLSNAIFNKIRKNAKKYPVEKVKGNYHKYTELGGSNEST